MSRYKRLTKLKWR